MQAPMPGHTCGRTTLRKAPKCPQPSSSAASSSERGTARKNPSSSHVQKGVVMVGSTTTSDQMMLASPSQTTMRYIGMNSRLGGIRYTRKITMPERSPQLPRSEEHTSELQSRGHLVCRLLLEK